jgi:hypothetical protein
MNLKAIVLTTALAMTSSVALAQPAPIGSSADFGNGAALNRGPVATTGEDLDFRTHRSGVATGIASASTRMRRERMLREEPARRHRDQ